MLYNNNSTSQWINKGHRTLWIKLYCNSIQNKATVNTRRRLHCLPNIQIIIKWVYDIGKKKKTRDTYTFVFHHIYNLTKILLWFLFWYNFIPIFFSFSVWFMTISGQTCMLLNELFCFVLLCEITLKQNGLGNLKAGCPQWNLEGKCQLSDFCFKDEFSFTYNKMHRYQMYSSINWQLCISVFSPPQYIYFFSSRISPFELLYSILPQFEEATTLWIL